MFFFLSCFFSNRFFCRVGYSYPTGGGAPRPASSVPMWRPPTPQQQQQQQPPPSQAYYQQDFQQQPPYYQQNFQQPPYYQQQQQQAPYYQHDFQQQQPAQYGYGQPPAPMFNAPPPAPAPPPPPPPPPPMPAANVPPAPIFDADMIANAAASLKSRQPVMETHTSFEQTTVIIIIIAILFCSLQKEQTDWTDVQHFFFVRRIFRIFPQHLRKVLVVLVDRNHLRTPQVVWISQKFVNLHV